MPSYRLPSLIAGLAALLVAMPALAETPRVGVVVAVEVNLAPGDGARLSALIGEALEQRLVIEAVSGADAARRLPPGGVPDGCLGEPRCLADLGARLSADQLLLVVAVKIGDRLQLDATWADVASGRAVPRPSIEISAALDGASRTTLIEAASRLVPDAPRRSSRPEISPDPGGSSTAVADLGDEVPAGRRMTRGAWIATGVAGAALAGGIGFGLAASSEQRELEDAGCGVTRPCASGADTVSGRALAADLLFATAAAAAGVAGYLYWRSDTVAMRAALADDGGALLLAGRF